MIVASLIRAAAQRTRPPATRTVAARGPPATIGRLEEKEKIPITRPFFGPEELRAVQLPLETGWVVQGPHVESFETKFAGYTRSAHAVATSSCTTALQIAVAALGLAPGDEVIVPAFTWISTANVVEAVGARPVFCDVDLATFNIDPGAIEPLVTERSVGLLPVHLFGLPAAIEDVLATARRRGLWVVEDCACSLGGSYDGRHTGTFGDLGCFSFHPRKSITTGEGGMITTQREELGSLARMLRDHGASRSDLQRHEEEGGFLLSEYDHLGFNYRMTDIQGALGSAQMDRLESLLEGRRQRAARYDELLSDLDWLATPVVPDDCIHGYQAYVCLFRPEEPTLDNVHRLHQQRNALMAELEERGIATRQGTHSPILSGYYSQRYGLNPANFPNSVIADRLSLALPLYSQMTDAEQDAVVAALHASAVPAAV